MIRLINGFVVVFAATVAGPQPAAATPISSCRSASRPSGSHDEPGVVRASGPPDLRRQRAGSGLDEAFRLGDLVGDAHAIAVGQLAAEPARQSEDREADG
jgi:hypothetical protein